MLQIRLFFVYFILAFIPVVFGTSVFKIGAIFDKYSSVKENALQLAIDEVNKNNFEDNPLFDIIVKEVSFDNPFEALKATCSLLEEGVIGILGPSSEENSNIVQSICDAKEIPHIETRWDDKYPLIGTIINLYPYPNSLTKTYVDILEATGWQDFMILYENNESLMRVGELLSLFDNKPTIIVRQLDKNKTDNYRSIFAEVRSSGVTHFLIDCSIDILRKVLLHAQQIGLMTNEYHYFITHPDMHTVDVEPFQYSRTNITGIRFINPENPTTMYLAAQILKDEDILINEYIAGWKLPVEVALIYDAIVMFSKTVKSLQVIAPSALSCHDNSRWKFGSTLLNGMKAKEHIGITGNISFDYRGLRSNFELDVVQLKEGGITKVATWNTKNGISIVRHIGDKNLLSNLTFVVITVLTEPYAMLKDSSNQLHGNERYEGFGIDLLKELSIMCGFNYSIEIREDKQNGGIDPKTKQWTGMIGDVINGRADLAIGDLTITSEREDGVDFTSPFMTLGIGILYKKASKATQSFFSFADPFALDVWRMILAAYTAVSTALFVMARICPSEWNNPYACVDEPEYLVNQLSLRNCFWFTTGAFMQQGTEIAPVGISTRMVAGVWWFFTLIMVSTYTANMASFLTMETPYPDFTNVEELVKYADKKGIKYGAKSGGATATYFREQTNHPVYAQIWDYMEKHKDEVMVAENKDGVEKAKEGHYAFFMESTSIEYETQRYCSLEQVGNRLDEKGYGIAMRKNSSYRNELSTAILKLAENGRLNDLKRKWWEERRGGGQCQGEERESEATPLDLKNVGGVFCVTIIGVIISALFSFMEFSLAVWKLSRRRETSFGDTFWKEIRFYLLCSMVKPVWQNSSKKSSHLYKENGNFEEIGLQNEKVYI